MSVQIRVIGIIEVTPIELDNAKTYLEQADETLTETLHRLAWEHSDCDAGDAFGSFAVEISPTSSPRVCQVSANLEALSYELEFAYDLLLTANAPLVYGVN